MITFDGKTFLRLAVLVMLPFALTALAVSIAQAATPKVEDNGMAMPAGVPVVPPGRAYIDGQEMYFIHTEVSDPEIAQLLSGMMDSPVIYTPSLADTPESMLADVYVFTNGVEGMGPLGFQPDVFVHAPGSDDYRALRRVILVTWAEDVEARELMSLEQIEAAQSAGELTIEQTEIVVNMPFIQWPYGER